MPQKPWSKTDQRPLGKVYFQPSGSQSSLLERLIADSNYRGAVHLEEKEPPIVDRLAQSGSFVKCRLSRSEYSRCQKFAPLAAKQELRMRITCLKLIYH